MNSSVNAATCSTDASTSCCENPRLIENYGETFCENCGLVVWSKKVMLNTMLNTNVVSVDQIIQKWLARQVSIKWANKSGMDVAVPYYILTHFNRKYGANIWSYSLPRITCRHKTEICKQKCYGKSYAFCYKHVRNRYIQNFQMTFLDGFVLLIVDQINRLHIQHVRIHTKGDFYSQEYFDKWCDIAKQCPQVKILAYTRNWEIDTSNKPSNFIIYYSIDFSTKHFNPTIPLLSFMFKAPEEVRFYNHLQKIPGAVVCSSRCHVCKFCWSGMGNVAFPIVNGRRSYKPENYHTPYQISDDKTGKRSFRKKKIRVTPRVKKQRLIDKEQERIECARDRLRRARERKEAKIQDDVDRAERRLLKIREKEEMKSQNKPATPEHPGYGKMTCKHCGEIISKINNVKHLQEKHPEVKIKKQRTPRGRIYCKYCGELMGVRHYKFHVPECPLKPVNIVIPIIKTSTQYYTKKLVGCGTGKTICPKCGKLVGSAWLKKHLLKDCDKNEHVIKSTRIVKSKRPITEQHFDFVYNEQAKRELRVIDEQFHLGRNVGQNLYCLICGKHQHNKNEGKNHYKSKHDDKNENKKT